MEDDADVAAQRGKIRVQVLDFGFGDMGIVKGLETVEVYFQASEPVFADRVGKTARVIFRFDFFGDSQ